MILQGQYSISKVTSFFGRGVFQMSSGGGRGRGGDGGINIRMLIIIQ